MENLEHNLKTIKSKLNANTKFCAVVKDDAYGHGIKNVIKVMEKYADYYSVATIDEATDLRRLTTKPILCLGEFQIEETSLYLKNNIEATISSCFTLKELKRLKLNKKLWIHLAVNTGMNRLGFNTLKEFKTAMEIIKNNSFIELKGIYSHISDANNKGRTEKQNALFNQYYALIPKTFKPLIHIANSSTMQLHNTMQYNMVRIGINLYGYEDSNLRPVMSVYAKVVHTTKLNKDCPVGYGSKSIVKKGTKLGIVSIGYGQGFLRANARFGFVIINGKLCKIVGNICMDMTIVDCTNANAKIGDLAIIMGESCGHKIDAQDLAINNNTISYEILTNFGKIKNSILFCN